MWDILSVKTMKESEKALIEKGTPSLELMRRAGLVLYHGIRYSGNVAILVGKGNNGGDGFALASLLASHELIPSVYKLSDEISDDAYFFENECRKKKVPIMPYEPDLGLLDDVDIIVDCLFGTGFTGKPQGIYKEAIEEINEAEGKVISCDINSGFNGDYGPSSLAVRSNITIAINSLKIGLLKGNFKKYVSSIRIGDIGIPLLHEEDHLLDSDEWNKVKNKNVLTDDALFYFEKEGHRYYRKPVELEIKTISYLSHPEKHSKGERAENSCLHETG